VKKNEIVEHGVSIEALRNMHSSLANRLGDLHINVRTILNHILLEKSVAKEWIQMAQNMVKSWVIANMIPNFLVLDLLGKYQLLKNVLSHGST
jgi:hypothetical protein